MGEENFVGVARTVMAVVAAMTVLSMVDYVYGSRRMIAKLDR